MAQANPKEIEHLNQIKAAPFANHIHGGKACTATEHDASCASHPGALIHCFEVHIPFIGKTVFSCLHQVS